MRRTLALPALIAVLAVAALGAFGACGGTGEDDISTAARDELAPLVAKIRSAADSSDPYGVALALADVRHAVETLHARGQMGDARAYEILAATAAVENRLSLVPTTTTTTTTTLPPAPPPNADHGKGNGKGKGKKD